MDGGNCEFCAGAGGTVLWESEACRVVLVDDADYPGFCRVVWNDHVREMTDLDPDARAEEIGVRGGEAESAEDLGELPLERRRVGLQLYPDKDHSALIGAIKARGAEIDTVLPYVYDAKAADANIVTAIDEMARGRIDALALTNLGQIRRLIDTARKHGWEDTLREGLAQTPIASVGPAVSDELRSHGLSAAIYPSDEAFFMRPLISAMATALAKNPPRVKKAS